MDMTEPELRTEILDGTLLLTLQRPEARNAISRDIAEGIAAAMDRLDADDDLRVAVIQGSGGAFSSGMDLKRFAQGEIPSVGERGFAGLVRRPPAKPLIAAVEGFALAGGFEIVLCADIVVAAENAVFGLPEVARGLSAAGGGLMRLPRAIPRNVALDLVLTGRRMDAAEAERWGLVNRLVPAGEALPAALEIAATIARNAPLAVRASKQVLLSSPDWPAEEAFTRQEAIVAPVRSSQDALEGATAFKERREPRWRGR